MSDNYCSCENQDVHANCCKVKRLEDTLSSSSKEISRLKGEVEESDGAFKALYGAKNALRDMYNDLHESIEALKAENVSLRGALEEAINYLTVGKQQFAPNTTNSLVDSFLERHARSPSSFAEESKALRGLEDTLKKCRDECSMDDPNFGNFTPLQFAARLGLIYQYSDQALADLKCARAVK